MTPPLTRFFIQYSPVNIFRFPNTENGYRNPYSGSLLLSFCISLETKTAGDSAYLQPVALEAWV
jgi:hypothetical protein